MSILKASQQFNRSVGEKQGYIDGISRLTSDSGEYN